MQWVLLAAVCGGSCVLGWRWGAALARRLSRAARPWRAVVLADPGGVRVCVKHENGTVLCVKRLQVDRPDFEDVLMDHVGEARGRAVALNVAEGRGS